MPSNELVDTLENKVVIGSVEPVIIAGKEFFARIDTGAKKCSLSKDIAVELDLGPVVEQVEVRSAHGRSVRDVVDVEVELRGVRMQAKFNISNRSKLQYPILIGRNLLKRGFLVDCSDEDRYN